jgi:hypothetical protein
MEGMVTDLALAREKQQNFEEWKKQNERQLPIDISVTVLTTGGGGCVPHRGWRKGQIYYSFIFLRYLLWRVPFSGERIHL